MSLQLTWYGHSALGLEIGGAHLLVDPFFTGNPAAKVQAQEVKADFILLTHGHGDHLGDTFSIAQRTGALVIANFEICNWLEAKGVTKVHAQHLGGGFQYPFGYLKLTHAEHGSSMPDGAYGGNPCGFLLTAADQQKYYLAGDTGLFGDMCLIGEEGLDLAVLPVGDNFTMGPADALRAVKMLAPRHVIPVHYSTFGLIDQDAQAWADQVQRETSTQVHPIKPGETISL
jgi:L-ascorbate metabolism protein UlaG (beta-lactamase superfamily)